jgi:undecaprenyl-diphosphatase
VRLWWLLAAAVGLALASASLAHARRPSISAGESRVFRAINGLPDALFPVLWPPMQLGNLVIGTGAGLVVAYVARDFTVAVGVLLTMVLKLVTERIVRRKMADYLAVRQRPGTSQPGAKVRGRDVPLSGPSFPSGHCVLVAGVGTVVAAILPSVWWWAPLAAMVLVALGRVYVGAHNPLDVTAGVGAGLVLGGLIAVFVR